MKCIEFRKKKIPLFIAKGLLEVTSRLLPLNKFHRDLFTAVFKYGNVKKK